MRRSFSTCILTALLLAGVSRTAFAEDEPAPHAVIDRALRAGGGADKIKQFKAVSFKADINNGDDSYMMSGLIAGPTLFRIEVDQKIVGSGDSMWIKQNCDGKETITESLPDMGGDRPFFDTYRFFFHTVSLPDRLLSLKGKDWKLKVVGEQAVNGVALRDETIDCRVRELKLHRAVEPGAFKKPG